MCILGDLLFTPVIRERAEHIALSAKSAPSDGLIMEFGVCTGVSLAIIADTLRPRLVYGFDSFKGLPSPWKKSSSQVFEAGAFRLEAVQKPPRDNTRIIVGMIEETLPVFLCENPGPLAFLHIDVDLGDVTAAILRIAGDRCISGTVLRFDEFCDWGGYPTSRYPEWPQHEYRAFMEWLKVSGKRVKPVFRDSLEGATFVVL